MRVPAICDNCGAIFPSGIEATNSSASFTSCTAGPCPACGSMGHIPDGAYKFVGNTIELLSGPERTISELEHLAKILNDARKNKATLEQVKHEIQEELPGLSSIKDLLPTNRSELYAFLALILSVITLLISQMSSEEHSKIEINNVINNVYQEAPANKPAKPQLKKKKPGRNEPCPCGSGKKYKKCCLLSA